MAKKTLKGNFEASKTAEREFYKALKAVARNSGHIISVHVDGFKIPNPEAMQAALNNYAKLIEPWARRQSEKLLDIVQRSNKRAYNAKSKAIGQLLKHDIADREVGKVALKMINEQVNLITSIPREAGLRAQDLAYKAVIEGTRAEPDQQVIEEIKEQLGFSTDEAISRARLISRTETARANAAINQARAQAVGSNQYRWHNSGDGAVRPSHKTYKGRPLQGRIFDWDNPPTLDDGYTTHPGGIFNCRCVLGSTNITSFPFIEKIFRRINDGEIITITLENGLVISATPNHPIYINGVFKSLNSFQIGDYVTGEENQTFNTINNDIKSFNISFEKIFDTLAVHPFFTTSTCRGGDFHGDISNEEINIINPNGGLIFERNIIVNEKLFELGLTEADKTMMYIFLSGQSNLFKMSNIPFEKIMSTLNLLFSLLRIHFTPLDLFCFALSPQNNSGFNQMFSNNISRNSEVTSNFVFAYALLIHGFDVIDIELNGQTNGISPFANGCIESSVSQLFAKNIRINLQNAPNFNQGLSSIKKNYRIIDKTISKLKVHVYTLQTSGGYYNIDGIYSKNCFAEPIFQEE